MFAANNAIDSLALIVVVSTEVAARLRWRACDAE